jgi:hypothetical protein
LTGATEIFDTRGILARIGLILAVALLAACAGGESEDAAGPPPPPRKAGIEVVNASNRDVMVRWFPKEDEPERGSAFVPACTAELLEITPGNYSLVVSSPHGLVRLGWSVNSDLRCCLAVARDGRVSETTERPPPPACS